MNCNQVTAGIKNINTRQAIVPKRGTQGVKGVLKGRCRVGCVNRRTSTPKQTIAKMKSAPIEVSCPKMLTGKKPATTMAKALLIQVV